MRQQGFTLVEVMVSLGVMTIGAMALIGMQQQTTRANVRSRDMTVAMQIAQNEIERLKLDGVAWNSVSDPTQDLANSPLLSPITTANTPGNFMAIPLRASPRNGVTRTLSNAFDYVGRDIVTSGADASTLSQVRFCASYRLTWIYDKFSAMRADVRVWWTKETPSHSILSDFPGCTDDNTSINPGGTLFNEYHVVYLSTALRPNGS